MNQIQKLWRFFTSPETILYIVFGVLTTIINILVFDVCFNHFYWSWEVSNALAWILSVVFAFFSNKMWVFRSKSLQGDVFFKELLSFLAARLFSLGVDYLCMWLFIDVFLWSGLEAKTADNVVVVIINYIFSKFLIFRKK